MVGAALGDARRHGADAHFRHQLDRDAGGAVDAFQVADQLRQVFDGIDVVVRRRRDQSDARRGMAHLGDILVDLVAGQLAAFAGLGALGHLDLDVVGNDQIYGGDTEAARRDLLGVRAHRVAIGHGHETIRFLAAFAGVGTAADAVHGDGQRGVRLAADGAEAHRPGGETLDDIDRRLDFVQGNAGDVGLAAHQAADGQEAARLLVDTGGEGLVLVRQIAAHGVLQAADGL